MSRNGQTAKVSIKATVARAIYDLTSERGIPPTVREIGARIGTSGIGNLHLVLQNMREDGMITWIDGRQRSIRLVGAGPLRADLETWTDDELCRVACLIEDVQASRKAKAA